MAAYPTHARIMFVLLKKDIYSVFTNHVSNIFI